MRSQPEQSGAQHQVLRQVERARGLLSRQAMGFHFRLTVSTHVNDRKTYGLFFSDHLHRYAINRGIASAQNLVPPEDQIECSLERCHIQRAGYPQALRDVVRSQIRFELMEKPKPLL